MSSRIDQFLAHIARVGEQTLFEQELHDKLNAGRQLRVKFGIDLTASSLHIGHAVNLWLLRDLQLLGHTAVIVLGDFTTRIGDPGGRMDVRPLQAAEQIKRNAEAILAQVKDILRHDDPTLFEVHYNSAWYDRMPLTDFFDLLHQVTHATLISRQTFQNRISAQRDIFAHEMLYPVLQGYDSVVLDADLTVVGSDQLYNEMTGRQLQEALGKPTQTVITTAISPGTDGELKQSKSLGNYIGLAHSPRDKFMRLMGIADHLVPLYLRLYTDMSLDQVAQLAEDLRRNTQLVKLKLAYAVVGRYHGHAPAEAERKHYERVNSQRARLEDMPVVMLYHARITVLELLMTARPHLGSKACRALIESGQFELNDETFLSPDSHVLVSNDDIIAIGKSEFARLMVLQMNEFVSERLLMRPIKVEDVEKVLKVLPQEQIAKYLAPFKLASAKLEPGKILAREVIHRVIAKPEPKDEWIWMIVRRDHLQEVLGVAHLSNVAGVGTENIWLNEAYHSGGYAEEALAAINSHAFDNMGINHVMFKSAFSFAAAPQEIEVLVRRITNMEPQPTRTPSPKGAAGAGKEGWRKTRPQQPAPRAAPTVVKTVAVDPASVKVKKERVRPAKSGFIKPPDKVAPKKPIDAPQPRGPKPTPTS